MTILTIKSTELASPLNYKLKVLLAGPSGSGKTTSLCTLPGKKLIIDYDGRKASLAGLPNVEVIDLFDPDPRQPQAWAKAEKLREELWTLVRAKHPEQPTLEGKLPWDSIAECGLTSLTAYAMNWSLLLPGAGNRGLGGAPAQQQAELPALRATPSLPNLTNAQEPFSAALRQGQ
jgi:hypothetical protein